MTGTIKESRTEMLAGIGQALRASIEVPTDTLITEDIPLMMTKLSRVAAVPVNKDDRGNRNTRVSR